MRKWDCSKESCFRIKLLVEVLLGVEVEGLFLLKDELPELHTGSSKMEVNGFRQCLLSLRDGIERMVETETCDVDLIRSFRFRLDQLMTRAVAAVHVLAPGAPNHFTECLQGALHALECVVDDESHSDGLTATVRQTGERGRPSFEIAQEQLEYFVQLGFSAKSIAGMLGVSKRTVQRRLHDAQIGISETYSNMTDGELDEIIREIKMDFPNVGYRIMYGLLKARGAKVQFHRIRQAMQRCDPAGVALRWISSVHIRRAYSVYGPQALCHVDGNHKLIRQVPIMCYNRRLFIPV